MGREAQFQDTKLVTGDGGPSVDQAAALGPERQGIS